MALADGSTLTLDTAAPVRPCVVDSVHGRLTALGTRFTVATSPAATLLDVLEDAVRVESADGSPAENSAARLIQAGESMHFDALQVAAVRRVDPAHAATDVPCILGTV